MSLVRLLGLAFITHMLYIWNGCVWVDCGISNLTGGSLGQSDGPIAKSDVASGVKELSHHHHHHYCRHHTTATVLPPSGPCQTDFPSIPRQSVVSCSRVSRVCQGLCSI